MAPFISGIVGTNLLSANFNGGALSPLLNEIGVKLSLDLVGFRDILASDLQVDLQQLAEGLSNRMISEHLHISEGTVKVHVKNLLRKANAKSRTEMAVRYLNN